MPVAAHALQSTYVMRSIVLWLVVLAAFSFACGTSSVTTQSDAGTCAIETTPASGGGVCCRTRDLNKCAGMQELGGWAATASACCSKPGGYIDQAYVPSTDSHGCAALVRDPICHCMCVPFDASASSDAD